MSHVNRPRLNWGGDGKYKHPISQGVVTMPMSWALAGHAVLGYKFVSKFGMNDDVGAAFETVSDLQAPYVWPAASNVVSITSGSVEDDPDKGAGVPGTGAWTINISGLDSNYVEQNEDITLNGAAAVVSVGRYIRLFRMRILTAGTGGTNAGAITATIGGVSAARILAGYGQTLMALWTVPAGYTGWLVNWYANTSVVNKANETRIRTRPFGGAWNTKRTVHINGSGVQQPWDFPLILTEKTDVEVQSKATDSSGDCAAGFDIVYSNGG